MFHYITMFTRVADPDENDQRQPEDRLIFKLTTPIFRFACTVCKFLGGCYHPEQFQRIGKMFEAVNYLYKHQMS